MASQEASVLQQIEKKMDILIHLQLLSIGRSEVASMSERIKLLSEMGLSPAEIGRIVAKQANYVSAVLGPKKGTSDGKRETRKSRK